MNITIVRLLSIESIKSRGVKPKPKPTKVRSMALVQAPPAPSALGRPNLDTSCTSAEVWLSMQPENMLDGDGDGDGVGKARH